MKTDLELKKDVKTELMWGPLIPAARVGVAVNGERDWNFQRRSVERMVRPLMGVSGITDDIRLKALSVPVNLSSRIQDALTRQAVREAKRIEISMDGSVVTLRGHVHSWAERSAAEGATWSAPGVSRVNNLITIEGY